MRIAILAYRGVMRSALHGIEEMLRVLVERHGAAIVGVVQVPTDDLPAGPCHLLFIPPSRYRQRFSFSRKKRGRDRG